MGNYLTNSYFNLFNGLLNFNLPLGRDLTFICGENGTGKSRVLEHLKNNISNMSVVQTNDGQPYNASRVAFYNPKRNMSKKETSGVLQQMIRDGKNKDSILNQLNQNYAEQFVEYPNTTDLFVISVNEYMLSKNKTAVMAVKIVKKEFESVIKQVLPYISISADWDNNLQQPVLKFYKYSHLINPTQLSVGENEIISLTYSIFSSKEKYDLYLIDEPEIHLNWSLEKNLFEFLQKFSKKYHKQCVIVTHSPVVFEEGFLDNSWFLTWYNNNITITKTPSNSQLSALVSRISKTIVKLDTLYDSTLFVEDHTHKIVFDIISTYYKKNIYVIEAGDRQKVFNLYKTLGNTLSNAIYIIDGDNDFIQNNKLKNPVIALKKYCMENYFLNIEIMGRISKNSFYSNSKNIEKLIIDKIVNCKNPEFTKKYISYISLAKLNRIEFFKIIEYMDGDQFFSQLHLEKELNFNDKDTYISEYLAYCLKSKKYNFLIGELIDYIQNSSKYYN